jgi:hypothetical protein
VRTALLRCQAAIGLPLGFELLDETVVPLLPGLDVGLKERLGAVVAGVRGVALRARLLACIEGEMKRESP